MATPARCGFGSPGPVVALAVEPTRYERLVRGLRELVSHGRGGRLWICHDGCTGPGGPKCSCDPVSVEVPAFS